jgi:hypothetical protein
MGPGIDLSPKGSPKFLQRRSSRNAFSLLLDSTCFSALHDGAAVLNVLPLVVVLEPFVAGLLDFAGGAEDRVLDGLHFGVVCEL